MPDADEALQDSRLDDMKQNVPNAQTLQENQKQFRLLADYAPVMIWMSGVDKLCTWFNRPWLEFTGRTMEQELGDGWADGVHTEDRPRCFETYVSSFDARQPFTMEYRLRRHDGEYRWVVDRGTALYDDTGGFAGYIGSCVDIADRRHTEQALRDSQSQLKAEAAALAALNDAISRLWHTQSLAEGLHEMLSATMRLLDADMGNVQTLDADRGVLTIAAQHGFEQEFLDFFREVSAEDDSACGRALRSNTRVVIEDIESDALFAPLRAVARDAGFRAVQSTPLVSSDGIRHGVLSTHWRSPHRPREQDLHLLDLYSRCAADFIEQFRSNQILRESENRLRAILNTAVDAIITIDRRGIMTAVNPATVRMFGYAPEELVGQNVRVLMPPPYRDEHNDYLDRYLKTGEARIIGIGREVEGRRKDGTIFPIDLAVSEVEGLGLFTGIVRDATARKQAERELNQYQSDLRAMTSELMLTEERERQQLAQDLHDGPGQALFRARMKLDQAPKEDPAVAEIGAILNELGKMVNTLTFELSPPVLRQLGLRPAIKWLARNLKQRYSLSVEIEDDGESFELDERVAVVVFRSARELLINIAKHAETDAARISVRRFDGRLQVRIEDQGKGFDLAAQSGHVEAGHFGLFSIRERMGYFGGSFEAQSAPGQGTRVTLTAPLAAEKGRGQNA